MTPLTRSVRFCLTSSLALLAVMMLLPGCPKPVTSRPEPVSCRLRKLPAKQQADQYDVETLQVMKKVMRPDSTAVDVGSFKGNILALMVQVAPKGTHYGFEPIPKFAAEVRKRFPSPLVKLHEMALANRTGTATFQFVTTNPAYSGLHRRGYPSKKEIITPITVKVDKLDNIIPATQKVAFIKVDVEGGEYGVLSGGVKTILRTKPVIVFEYGGSSRKYGVTNAMMYTLITKTLGLKLNLMSCWMQGEPPLTLAQFNAGYARGNNWYYIAYP